MRLILFILFLGFSSLNLVAQDNQLTFYNSLSYPSDDSYEVNLSLHKIQKDGQDRINIKRGLLLTGSGSTLVGLGSMLLSRATYARYRNMKNEIVYSSNDFSQADLDSIDRTRLKRFKNATRQLRFGQVMYGLGVLQVGVSFFISDEKKIKKADF